MHEVENDWSGMTVSGAASEALSQEVPLSRILNTKKKPGPSRPFCVYTSIVCEYQLFQEQTKTTEGWSLADTVQMVGDEVEWEDRSQSSDCKEK